MSTEPDRPWGSNFTPEEIAETRARKGLLSMELELSRECNLRCVYCYASSGKKLHNELTREEIDDALDQAIALGARRIIVIGGGEPLMYPGVMDIMRTLRERGIVVDLFTNGTLLTPAAGRASCSRLGVSPVVKLNSMREEVQDALAAVPGTFKLIQQGLEQPDGRRLPDRGARRSASRRSSAARTSTSCPGCGSGRASAGIVPYFEMITFQGRAKQKLDLNVSSEELRRVFFELSRIDRERFGLVWEPHPPIAALACNRHEYSCTLNAQGYIQPCVGVDMFIGNIRHAPLAEILATAPVMETMRKLRGNLKGACGSCDQAQRVLRLPRAGLPRHRRLPRGRPALLEQPPEARLNAPDRFALPRARGGVPPPSPPLPADRPARLRRRPAGQGGGGRRPGDDACSTRDGTLHPVAPGRDRRPGLGGGHRLPQHGPRPACPRRRACWWASGQVDFPGSGRRRATGWPSP